MDYLNVKVSLPASMLETRWLEKLRRLSGEDLALSSWWSSLVEETAFYGRMDLVIDMATDVKREMRLNTFGMPFIILYLS